jgi:hypothetical protein
MTPRLALAVASLAAAASAALAQSYTPGPHNIALPDGRETRFIRFATVDKPDRKIIRHLYVNPEAFAAARPGGSLPYGTLIIMADTRARLDAQGNPLLDLSGRFIPEPGWIGVFAQQKERGWGEGYPPEKRNGEWEHARFNPDGSRHGAPWRRASPATGSGGRPRTSPSTSGTTCRSAAEEDQPPAVAA